MTSLPQDWKLLEGSINFPEEELHKPSLRAHKYSLLYRRAGTQWWPVLKGKPSPDQCTLGYAWGFRKPPSSLPRAPALRPMVIFGTCHHRAFSRAAPLTWDARPSSLPSLSHSPQGPSSHPAPDLLFIFLNYTLSESILEFPSWLSRNESDKHP